MFSKFFIFRPKFAFVISIVISLAGLLAIQTLPVTMYPQITPPVVQVSTVYPGASAQVVEETVIRPIEERINGIEDMLYIKSTASNNGSAVIQVYFATGTDDDMAQVNVQNRVAIAEPALPQEVRRQGITVQKQSTDMLMGINLIGSEGQFDQIFLSNYATNYLTEPLGRIPGVASAEVMGSMSYAMRIWLNPNRMASLEVTVSDVQNALNEQNLIVAAGKLGAAPAPEGQQFEYSIQAHGRLENPEEFDNVVIRARLDGSIVRLKDIGRVEMGSESYDVQATLNGNDSTFLVIYQLPDGNATAIADQVKERMQELSDAFPQGLEYKILYDTTNFINRSIEEVVVTLFQAVALVILVVFLFLQSWRATIIPTLAIPVSLIGTFACMALLGYSINLVTLFGLVLAIGIVVDDAIVVIENVERIMQEEGLSPKDATVKSMQQVTGPVIATTLVLLAVFVPVGFMPGITGELYKQFSVTIACAVLISSLNALTLSPALCGALLKANNKPIKLLQPVEKAINWLTGKYQGGIHWALARSARIGVFVAVLLGGCAWLIGTVPTGFVPPEDQGYLFVDVQLPDAASTQRTAEVISKIGDVVSKDPAVSDFIAVSGSSLIGGPGSNNGLGIIILKDWDERTTPELGLRGIIPRLMGQLWTMPDAQIMVFNPPPIPGLGQSSGFEYQLLDAEGRSPGELAQVLNGLIVDANARDELNQVFSTFRANVPQFHLEVDRDKAKALGISLADIYSTLQANLGSLYINDFNKFSRTYKVMIQSEGGYRTKPEDLAYYYVRSADGSMVPLLTLASLTPVQGPTSITHFNLYRSAQLSGQSAPGYSSGQAIDTMAELSAQLPEGYTHEWSGQTRQEIEAGNLAPLLFGLAILFVYLFLVAQYESWTIPVSVIGAVPLAIFGALMGLFVIGLDNNIYAQVGLVLLIGLSTKTAILIVEFAMEQRRAGLSVQEAAFKAAHLRFRAVLMTALSFVLGVLPLVFASGAGAASRVSLGFTVLCGMLSATILGTLLVPLFYQWVQKVREKFGGEEKAKT